MSLLWSGKTNWKLLTCNFAKPSPTCQSNLRDSARNPKQSLKERKKSYNVISGSIEGISLSAFCFREWMRFTKTFLRSIVSSGLGAGMTVEASIVLPLFLFLFLNLGCAIEMVRLQGNLQLALWQTGRELSVYGYALDSGEMPAEAPGDEDWWKDLGGKVFSSVYIKNRLVKLAGKAYLDSSPLTRGTESLQLWQSDIFGSGDIMDIVVTYSVSPWSTLAGFPSFRMVNRYYAHIWNGYQVAGEEENAAGNKTVYVTSESEVYHLHRDCTHLRLSVRAIAGNKVDQIRNQKGGRYRPCEKCGDNGIRNILYITEEGDCYHFDRECSGLRRSIYAVLLREAANMRPCSRCSQGAE